MTFILLIDDDPLIADVVTVSLGNAGYTVGCLTDGQRAVEVIELKRPALVLLDCAMPFVPGVEVLRRIRTSSMCFAVPVLMLTARASSTDKAIALRAGATGYMAKPIDLDRLAVTVGAMVSDSWTRQKFVPAHRLTVSQ